MYWGLRLLSMLLTLVRKHLLHICPSSAAGLPMKEFGGFSLVDVRRQGRRCCQGPVVFELVPSLDEHVCRLRPHHVRLKVALRLPVSTGVGDMSMTVVNAEGVTVLTLTSDPNSSCPLICQILQQLCYSPGCCTVSKWLKENHGMSQSILGVSSRFLHILHPQTTLMVPCYFISYMSPHPCVWRQVRVLYLSNLLEQTIVAGPGASPGVEPCGSVGDLWWSVMAWAPPSCEAQLSSLYWFLQTSLLGLQTLLWLQLHWPAVCCCLRLFQTLHIMAGLLTILFSIVLVSGVGTSFLLRETYFPFWFGPLVTRRLLQFQFSNIYSHVYHSSI